MTQWNDDRGFGFVLPAQGTDELFIHISAFPKGSGRPELHDLISFEIGTDQQGRKRALQARRPGEQAIRLKPQRNDRSPFFALSAIAIALIALASFYFTDKRHVRINAIEVESPRIPSNQVESPTTQSSPELQDQSFQCDGRIYCSQMTSCSEARYFISHCPGTSMDGDNDGEPCESQWCS
ncbi:MAG: excalibur calcium-binding domain-containing protein [Dokdonella sp.]